VFNAEVPRLIERLCAGQSHVVIFLNFNFFDGSRLNGRGPCDGHSCKTV
jgi:hypothetical protein